MDNLVLSFNVVAPLLLYMIVGALLRRSGIVSRATLSQLSQLLYYTAIPALCLDNLRQCDLSAVLADPFVLYMGVGIIALFLLLFAVVPLFCKENRRRGVLIHGIFRSNDGVFGMAVATSLFGQGNLSLMVLAMAITIPVFNALAVFVMEFYRGGKPNAKRILLQLVKNPILIACVAGVALSLLKWDLPVVLAKPLAGLSGVCAPLGFLALGGTLTFASLRENRRALAVTAILRLVLIPLAALSILYAMGYRGDPLLVALIIFGAPTAMSVFPMACSMNGDEALASGLVAVTSTLSLLTIFLFIFFMKQTGVA